MSRRKTRQLSTRRPTTSQPTTGRLGPVLVLAAIALALLAPAGSAQTTPGSSTAAPLLTLTGQSGWVSPVGTFNVDLAVGSLPAGSRLVARLYSRVTTSARLAQTARGDGLGGQIQPAVTVPLDQAQHTANGLALSFPIVANGDPPPYGFHIFTAGVYPMSFGILGPGDQETGRIVTHLIRLPAPGSGQAPLAVAMVVPVHAPVAHDPTGASTIDPATLTGLQGLIAQLNRRPTVPLTLTPTPETVDALGERDRSTGATPVVASLTKASGAGRQVVSGSYVAVDQGAWVSQGLGASLGAQFDAGAATLTAQLATPLDRRTLVVDATTTPEALSDQVGRGIGAAVVPSDLLVPIDRRNSDETLTQTFDLASSNDDRIPAVASDARLSGMLVAGDNPTYAAHEVLAEVALLSLDQSRYQPCILASSDAPGCSRGLALELPSSADQATPVAAALLDAFADRDGTGGSPSASPGQPLATAVTVNDLMGVVDQASASFRTRAAGGAVLVRQLVATSPASLGSYPNELKAVTGQVAGFRSMLHPDDPKGADIATSLDQVVLCSGAAEFDEPTRTSYLDGARSTLQDQLSLITAPDQLVVTLTSTQAHVPISINNALDYPVKVALRLSSAKLEFPGGTTQTVDLAPDQPTRIEIPVQTRASGSFPLDVTVWSPDGAVSIAATRVTVRSTAVSGVGLALTIAAGLFLVLWWGRHFRNARRDKSLVASTHPSRRGPSPDLDLTTGPGERAGEPGERAGPGT